MVTRYVFRYKDGRYEKEGGWQTTELSEAKVLGWRAAGNRRWNRDPDGPHGGELVPVEIVLRG